MSDLQLFRYSQKLKAVFSFLVCLLFGVWVYGQGNAQPAISTFQGILAICVIVVGAVTTTVMLKLQNRIDSAIASAEKRIDSKFEVKLKDLETRMATKDDLKAHGELITQKMENMALRVELASQKR